ncbi:hypothetical protein [Xanthomonas hawaiiensis]|uniref:hypothetical protein n=1 Tax=Xanthomonas hawaiiensis TaxID=3003247 RepID=UPI003CCDBD34
MVAVAGFGIGFIAPGGGYGAAGKSAIKRLGPKGVVRVYHNASVMVRRAEGQIISHERIVSGNMTPTEKALGFPQKYICLPHRGTSRN